MEMEMSRCLPYMQSRTSPKVPRRERDPTKRISSLLRSCACRRVCLCLAEVHRVLVKAMSVASATVWFTHASLSKAATARSPALPTDLTELSLPPNISIRFPEGKEKTQHFEITIRPDEGIYKWVRLMALWLGFKMFTSFLLGASSWILWPLAGVANSYSTSMSLQAILMMPPKCCAKQRSVDDVLHKS